MKKSLPSQSSLVGLALAAGFLLLAPLLFMAHGCDDDLAVSIARNRQGYFSAAWNAAKGWGRFYEVVAYNLAQVPFVFGNLTVANLFRILSTASVLTTLWFFVRLLTERKDVASLSTILVAVVMYTGPGYNPYHCYPLWFQPPLMFTFLSWTLFLQGLRQNRPSRISASAVAQFAAMLFYEPFVLFGIGHFLLALFEQSKTAKLAPVPAFVSAFRRVLPVFIASLLYAVIFFGFQKLHPSTYPGSKPSMPHLGAYFYTWFAMTKPTVQFSQGKFLGALNGFLHMRGVFAYAYVVAFVVVVGLATAKALRVPVRESLRKPALLGAVASLFFMFLPNAVYGLTEQYRDFARRGLCAPYIGTYYSTFFWATFLLCVAIALVARPASAWKKTYQALIFVLVVANAFTSAVQTANRTNEWKYTRRVWDVAEAYVAHLKSAPESKPARVVAPSLWATRALTVPDVYDFWTNYFQLQTQQPLQVLRRFGPPSQDLQPVATTYLTGLFPSLVAPPLVVFGESIASLTPQNVRAFTILSQGKLTGREVVFQGALEGGANAQCRGASLAYQEGQFRLHITALPVHCELPAASYLDLGSAELVGTRG